MPKTFYYYKHTFFEKQIFRNYKDKKCKKYSNIKLSVKVHRLELPYPHISQAKSWLGTKLLGGDRNVTTLVKRHIYR